MATPFVRKEYLIFGSTPRTRRGDRVEAPSDVIGFLSGLRESLVIWIRANELLPSLSPSRSSFSSRWAVLLGSRHSQPRLSPLTKPLLLIWGYDKITKRDALTLSLCKRKFMYRAFRNQR